MDTKILSGIIEKMISEAEKLEKKPDKKAMKNMIELNIQLKKQLE
jgi:hypothetical protein